MIGEKNSVNLIKDATDPDPANGDSPEFKNWKGTTQPSDVTELGSFWILSRLSCFPFSHRHYGFDTMLKQGFACKVFQKLKVKMQENEILAE